VQKYIQRHYDNNKAQLKIADMVTITGAETRDVRFPVSILSYGLRGEERERDKEREED
jgi:hypothetical protein